MILVIDNFIKDKVLLDKIKSDKTFFSNVGQYYWWPGWWTSDVNTIKKELIQYIWADNCPISESFSIAGFEYWTGIQSAEENGFKNDLGIHIDKDEALFKDVGEIDSPVIGTVYYTEQEEFEGGMLEVYTNGLDSEPERVYAKPNRLIIFDAGKVSHRVSTVTKGTRKAIAINLWSNEPYAKQNGNLLIEQ